MGRSAYTPSTTIYLYKEAGIPLPLSARSTRSSSASTISSYLIDLDDSQRDKAPAGQEMQSSLGMVEDYATAKDSPLPWRVSAFDPNDDDLPLVTERFIDTSELPCPHLADLADLQETYGESEEQEGETVIDEEEYDEEEEEEEDFEEGHDEYEQENGRERQHLVDASEIGEDGHETGWPSTEEHESLNSHTGFRFNPLANLLASTSIPRQDFSPSMGVFHSHTLPLVLPSGGEIQLMHQERRSSNGSNARLEA